MMWTIKKSYKALLSEQRGFNKSLKLGNKYWRKEFQGGHQYYNFFKGVLDWALDLNKKFVRQKKIFVKRALQPCWVHGYLITQKYYM